ncbi:MAG: integrase arm-type DNA-binding domain-containing protein [Mariprofundaceae bacterium]|nr:integrase arm-type DNA-binding domain-containing protein [Mariprofundaceae bacterium]
MERGGHSHLDQSFEQHTMAGAVMMAEYKRLTVNRIHDAVLDDGVKQKTLWDGDGLYLLLIKKGKYWRFKYTYHKKQKAIALGVFPKVGLSEAREKRNEMRLLLQNGIDPAAQKAKNKQCVAKDAATARRDVAAAAKSFETVAREWFEIRRSAIAASTYGEMIRRFDRHVFPHISSIIIGDVTRLDVNQMLKIMAEKNILDSAHRVGNHCKNIFEYACDSGYIENTPRIKTTKVLPVVKTTNIPAIVTPSRIGELLRAIDEYHGHTVVCLALRLLPYLFVRAGEFRRAHWCEFDLDGALWTIPAAHRKLKRADQESLSNVHYVPLSSQAVAILRDIATHTGRDDHVFPSVRGDARPMSENTINAAIAALGFKGEMVGNGWRSAFSTCMNSMNFNPDIIERQLAHVEKDKVRRAYNRDVFLDQPNVRSQREKIMQAWADYIDSLRNNGLNKEIT